MFIDNRVILKDNAAFTDISVVVSDPYAGEQALALVAAEDALYVGSDMPFNHRFFMLSEKNVIAGSVAVSIFNGTEFVACEDVQDFTKLDGAPFARSGIIRWELPADQGWGRVAKASDITELAGVNSKAAFWAKLTFSAAFAFGLKYVGFRFARDADLNTYYKALLAPKMMQTVNGGLPMQDYDAYHVLAAEEIIRDLRKIEVVRSCNNVLVPERFTDAACHKLAEMAYSSVQNQDRLEFAQAKYREAMGKMVFDVDQNGNGRLDRFETVQSGRLSRV